MMYVAKPVLAPLLKGWVVGLLLCTAFAVSQAATSLGQFSVNITLTGKEAGAGVNTAAQSPPGVCVSESLSERTNALVRVVCGTGQFVSITANPNARFLGTHGGAFRFVSNSGNTSSDPQQGGANDFYPGIGTVTAWRIYNVNGSEEPFEVLLTF